MANEEKKIEPIPGTNWTPYQVSTSFERRYRRYPYRKYSGRRRTSLAHVKNRWTSLHIKDLTNAALIDHNGLLSMALNIKPGVNIDERSSGITWLNNIYLKGKLWLSMSHEAPGRDPSPRNVFLWVIYDARPSADIFNTFNSEPSTWLLNSTVSHRYQIVGKARYDFQGGPNVGEHKRECVVDKYVKINRICEWQSDGVQPADIFKGALYVLWATSNPGAKVSQAIVY
ncbi:hypothetical protein ACFX2I_004028 [Malus domestica]